MILKPRKESKESKLLRCLNARMKLSEKEANDYCNLEKGFEGEKRFDALLEDFAEDWLVLNDLLLESNNTVFQIDSLAISQKKIYLFEIKNYEGDFYIDGDRWHGISGAEIKSPLFQLQRSESLLRRLLQDLGLDFPIEAYLIFINPHFHLYQAPLNLPAVFPTQLNRFIGKLKKEPSKLKEKHSAFANQLSSLHLSESPYTRLPNYNDDQLKKGIACPSCRSIFMRLHERTLVCQGCAHKENIDTGVLRTVMEFHMLFPDKKITTPAIQEWCGIIKSRKTIWRTLSQNFKLVGHSKSAHYIEYKKQ